MASGPMNGVVTYLRRLVLPANGHEATDEQLLDEFTNRGDEAAFTALVQRYGPLVWSVCRRVLAQVHDAEDAFQATFLILVRKARSIGKRGSVRSWLYGVAYRTAVRARTQGRRRAGNRPFSDLPAGADTDELIRRDLRGVLDEEINRLPEHQRMPVILCYLEGKTNAEAALELGCPRGTIAIRLARARKQLRPRLARRGLALSLAGVDELLACQTTNAVPTEMMDAAVRSAQVFGAGKTAATGGRVAQAAVLAEGVLQTMLLTKVKTTAGLLLGAIVLCAGAVFVTNQLASPGAQALSSTPSARAPFQAQDQSADAIRSAITRGVDYLKKNQKESNWEHHSPVGNHKGGVTALALVGLLEAGVKREDEFFEKGLRYLRSLKPESTYVTALQTVVFGRADPKKDRELIQRNADLLVQSRCKDNTGRFTGWTYSARPAVGTDNSNTQYAVLGLHAAKLAGAKIEDKVWQQIQDYYLRTQLADGGWGYAPGTGQNATFTMTSARVCGLLITSKHLQENAKGFDEALANGWKHLGDHFTVNGKFSPYYQLHGISRAGRLAGKKEIGGKEKNQCHDWYREGVEFLLKNQQKDGSWIGGPGDKSRVNATSFALIFLALP
jgi:RNA polymerase sigma factor (sigma-70 family)